MRFHRVWTKPGDPYKGVAFGERESRITNPDGSVVFEMKGVTAPADWSQTAVDLLAQKYLRKAGVPSEVVFVGEDGVPAWLRRAVPFAMSKADDKGPMAAKTGAVEGCERDARQVFRRLAGAWTYTAWKQGYFRMDGEGDLKWDAQEEVALAFYEELLFMLATQRAAPASPQWFNTGLWWAYGLAGEASGLWGFDTLPTPQNKAECSFYKVVNLPDSYARPQASACFIQRVSDTLLGDGGIMDLVQREARVFKFGGGSGSNFSALRGDGEPLSGGGQSSGLLSWLRVLDRGAGAIKSGGVTRRAAKMVVVDDDHPDLLEFIDWKVEEEWKAACLVGGSGVMKAALGRVMRDHGTPEEILSVRNARAAGVPERYVLKARQLAAQGRADFDMPEYDADMNGGGIGTVSGQNANNSVRLSRAFLNCAQRHLSWPLRKRTDGTLSRPVMADTLLDRVAFASWYCADPGVIFGDTVNDWNTCPTDGEIVACNPCFTGDTRILTEGGLLTIRELVERGMEGDMVRVARHDGSWSAPSQLMITGVNPIKRVTLSDGRVLRTTPNHKWLVDGREVEARQLQAGNRVEVFARAIEWRGDDTLDCPVTRRKGERFLPRLPKQMTPPLARIVGHLVGDGCVDKSGVTVLVYGTGPGEQAMLPEHKAELERAFGVPTVSCPVGNGCLQLRVCRKAVGRFFRWLGVQSVYAPDKRVPEVMFTATKPVVSAFLSGYFGADGTATGRVEAGEADVSATSASLGLLRDVQQLLALFGIRTEIKGQGREGEVCFEKYVRAASYRLRVHPADLAAYQDQIGFTVEAKNRRLAERLLARENVKAGEWPVTVVSVEDDAPELTYNLTEPEDHRVWANGVYIKQCAEYHFLEDTACNLASLNLLRFLHAERPLLVTRVNRLIDDGALRHAARLWTVVLDVTVGMAGYPSAQVAEGSAKYRTLGLGWSNLGALLMRTGIPYDSAQGRAVAACLAAIIHCTAYKTSALLAAELGPFPRYQANSAHCLRVLRNHAVAAGGEEEWLGLGGVGVEYQRINPRDLLPAGGPDTLSLGALYAAARRDASEMVEAAKRHGLRNAQVTLCAPTGTIGLLMDCDTTGIEPDYALVKHKKLAGGGTFTIVNQSVGPALGRLGYDARAVEAALDYLDRHATLEGAPGLSEEHLPVFDCATPCGASGVRSIRPRAHLEMMAAVQPFLSGAISKTCNTPTGYTAAEVRADILEAHRLGIKAWAMYRAGSKLNEPLSSGGADEGAAPGEGDIPPDGLEELSRSVLEDGERPRLTGAQKEALLEGPRGAYRLAAAPIEIAWPARERKLPDRRHGFTDKVKVGGRGLFLRTGQYPDGTLGEIFVDIHREGSDFRSVMNAFAMAVSIGLQHGVPLEKYVDTFLHMKFEPNGPVQGHPEIKNATSMVDFIVRDLAIAYLKRGDLANAPANGAVAVRLEDVAPREAVVTRAASDYEHNPLGYDSEPCDECGNFTLVRAGSCKTCKTCGHQSGCA